MLLDPKSLKMYIAVLDEVPDHMVPVLVAHAVLGAEMQFSRTHYGWDHSGEDGEPVEYSIASYPNYLDWKYNSFKKCVLRVNRKEFQKIEALSDTYLGYENTVLNGEKSCAVVCPRYETPNVLKFAKLWKPNTERA